MGNHAVARFSSSDVVLGLRSRPTRFFGTLAILLYTTAVVCVGSSTAFAANVYWSDFATDQILAGAKDGSGNVVELFNINDYPNQFSSANPGGVAVDSTYVYWVEGSGSILRVQKNGNGSVTELFNAGDYPGAPTGIFAQDVAVDDSFVYWSDLITRQLLRGAIDGSGPVVEIYGAADYPATPSAIRPRDIDVDDSFVYWVDNSNSLILRGPKDGNAVATVLFDAADYPGSPGTTSPVGLSVDDEYVYWTDIRSRQILRGPKNGSGSVVELYNDNDSFRGIAVDANGLFWHTGSTSGNSIRTASKDGSGTVNDLYTGAQYPGGPVSAAMGGIAVDPIPEPSSVRLLLFGMLALLKRMRPG